MVKFEKQVAKNKISQFLKTTPLVIFLHCIDQKDFYEKLAKALIANKPLQNQLLSSIEYSKAKKEGNLNIAEIKNCIALEGLVIKLVKNNYAKKALLENKALTDKNKISGNSLFKASHLLLAFKEINCLPKIKDFIEQDKNINILGAIYKQNNVIDYNQIKTLASISENKQIYANLITVLKTQILTPQMSLANALNFRYLLQHQYKILSLSQILYLKKYTAKKV